MAAERCSARFAAAASAARASALDSSETSKPRHINGEPVLRLCAISAARLMRAALSTGASVVSCRHGAVLGMVDVFQGEKYGCAGRCAALPCPALPRFWLTRCPACTACRSVCLSVCLSAATLSGQGCCTVRQSKAGGSNMRSTMWRASLRHAPSSSVRCVFVRCLYRANCLTLLPAGCPGYWQPFIYDVRDRFFADGKDPLHPEFVMATGLLHGELHEFSCRVSTFSTFIDGIGCGSGETPEQVRPSSHAAIDHRDHMGWLVHFLLTMLARLLCLVPRPGVRGTGQPGAHNETRYIRGAREATGIIRC